MYLSNYEDIPYGDYQDGKLEVGEWTFSITNKQRVRFDGPFSGQVLQDRDPSNLFVASTRGDKTQIGPNQLRRGIRHFLHVWERRWAKVKRRFERQMPALREHVQCLPWHTENNWPKEATPERGDKRRSSSSQVNQWRLWVADSSYDTDTRLVGPKPEIYGYAGLPEGFHYAGGKAMVRMVHKGEETFWWGRRCDGEGFPIYDGYGSLRQVVHEMQNEERDDHWNL